MYTVHDFLRGDISIVIKKEEQYEPTVKWFRMYGFKIYGNDIGKYSYDILEGDIFSISYKFQKRNLEYFLINRDGYDLSLTRKCRVITIEQVSFDENRLDDGKYN